MRIFAFVRYTNPTAQLATSGGGTVTLTAPGATESGTTVTIRTAGAHGRAVDDVVTIAGVGVGGYNGTLQLWMTDNGEPGANDTLGIQVLNKNGGMWFSSSWSGTKTVEQKLGGGNLAVR